MKVLNVGKSFLSGFVVTFFSTCQLSCNKNTNIENRIRNEVNNIRMIDTHEHLASEEEMLNRKSGKAFDFSHLFEVYIYDDLCSTGYSKKIQKIVQDKTIPIIERWKLIEPFWNNAENTSYARMIRIVVKDLFDIDSISVSTVEELSKRINDAYKPGWYRNVLKEKSKIDLSILDFGHIKRDNEYYNHVERFDNFVLVYSASQIRKLCTGYNIEAKSLADFEASLRKAFAAGVNYGIVAVKNGMAYQRTLVYENTDREEANLIFKKMFKTGQSLSFDEVKPLQDYMWHQIVKLADEYNLPIQIHTGLQAWGENEIRNSQPTLLTNLFNLYPNVKFIIFHGSYPYGGELSVLAKNYPNVYIDLCWTYLISPSYSERFLYEWLETVPASKIMGFGGDHINVEGIYAHSFIAREVVSKVLTKKVLEGHMSEYQAIKVAKMLLRNNAIHILKLNCTPLPL